MSRQSDISTTLALTDRRARGANGQLTPKEAHASDDAVDVFVKVVGGTEALRDALAIAADRPEVDEIVSMLLDPRYEGYSLRSLCRLANLTVVDLFKAYKSAMLVKAHLEAYKAITDRLVPVVVDVMERAAPYKVPCGGCGATGQIPADPPTLPPITCPDCNGHKQVLMHPDLDRQKLALEIAQLVTKSAGIQIQQNAYAPAAPERPASLVDLQQAVRDLTGGARTPIVDAEPVAPAVEGV